MMLLQPIERQAWQLSHDQIKLQKKLGSGAFGEVWKAEFCRPGARKKQVAVKVDEFHSIAFIIMSILQTLRTTSTPITKTARQAFAAEARITRKYKHPNIVRLFGMAIAEEPLMTVLQLCEGEVQCDTIEGDCLQVDRCSTSWANCTALAARPRRSTSSPSSSASATRRRSASSTSRR